MMKSAVSAVALTVALATPTALWAQQDSPATAAAEEADPGEIVVTAQRRAENLQDVPMSITAVTADKLERSVITTSENLTQVTPGLNFARSSVNAQPTIRGIGTRNAGPGDEPNVALYVDGVYQAEQFNNFQELSSIERIEVLKGPQGTLFGRNATGGAINIVTAKPSFTPSGKIAATYGRFDYMKATAYLTGPVVDDKLAASISAYGSSENNYYKNLLTNRHNGDSHGVGVRAKLLFTPAEGVEFQLNGFYADSDSANVRNGTPINGNSIARRYLNDPIGNPKGLPINILVPTAPWTTSTDVVPNSAVRQKQVDAHASIDLGFATLSGLLSYSRSTNTVRPDDFDITPLPISELDQFYWNTGKNEELVLTSNGDGKLEWILGATGFQGSAKQNFYNIASITGVRTVAQDLGRYQGTRGYAAFGEATYNLLGGLYLTGGIRYSSDRKEASNGPNNTTVTSRNNKTWTNWAPRAVARYEFSPSSNVYLSYSEGFKTGTFNPTSAAGVATPAQPEKANAFEAGFKTRLAPGLRFNGAAFYSKYKQLQTSVNIVLPSGIVATFIQNAESAKIKGIESSLDWNVTRNFNLNAGLSILDTKIGNFPNASGVNPIFNAAGQPIGNASATINVTGNNLIRSPKYTLNVGASYVVPLGGDSLTFATNAFFSGRYYFDLANRVNQPSYTVINGSARYDFKSGFYATVFVENVTNEKYAMTFSSNVYGDVVQLSKPRWMGGTIGYKF